MQDRSQPGAVSLRDHQRFGRPMPRTGNQLGRTCRARPTPARRAARMTTSTSTHSRRCGRRWRKCWAAGVDRDARFQDRRARWDNRTELNGHVEAWHACAASTSHAPDGRCGRSLRPAGHASAGRSASQGARDDRRRGLPDPLRTYQTVGCPINCRISPVAVSPSATAGEHTDALLNPWRGRPDEAKRLRQEGVV